MTGGSRIAQYRHTCVLEVGSHAERTDLVCHSHSLSSYCVQLKAFGEIQSTRKEFISGAAYLQSNMHKHHKNVVLLTDSNEYHNTTTTCQTHP